MTDSDILIEYAGPVHRFILRFRPEQEPDAVAQVARWVAARCLSIAEGYRIVEYIECATAETLWAQRKPTGPHLGAMQNLLTELLA